MPEPAITLRQPSHAASAALMRATAELSLAWAHLCDACALLADQPEAEPHVADVLKDVGAANVKLGRIDLSVGML